VYVHQVVDLIPAEATSKLFICHTIQLYTYTLLYPIAFADFCDLLKPVFLQTYFLQYCERRSLSKCLNTGSHHVGEDYCVLESLSPLWYIQSLNVLPCA